MLTPDYGHIKCRECLKCEFRVELETVPQKYAFGASNCIIGAAKLPQKPRLRASDCAHAGPYHSPKGLLFPRCLGRSCAFTTTFFIGASEWVFLTNMGIRALQALRGVCELAMWGGTLKVHERSERKVKSI